MSVWGPMSNNCGIYDISLLLNAARLSLDQDREWSHQGYSQENELGRRPHLGRKVRNRGVLINSRNESRLKSTARVSQRYTTKCDR